MKVFLTNPPPYAGKDYIREGRCMQQTGSWGSLWMPLSLAYTAAFLRQSGFEIRLIDCQAQNMGIEDLLVEVGKFQPQLVVINTGFPSIRGDMATSQMLKSTFANIKTLAIGMYPTLLRKRMLEEFSHLDFAAIGEPEWVSQKLACAMSNGSDLDNIRGLAYRVESQIKESPPQTFGSNNLEELPFPARDLLDNAAYRQVYSNEKFTHINIARGCTYKCTFCNAPAYYGNRFRKRSIQSIISEIQECVLKYDIRTFIFWAEEYTLENEFADKLADGIIKNGLKVSWYARARVDNVTLPLLQKMRAAGCKGISLGIESINEEVYKRIHKGIKPSQVLDAIKIAKSAGIKITGHFVFGFPGDTQDSALATIKFAKRSGLDLAQFYCAVPYPGTKYGELAAANGWIQTDDYSRFHLAEATSRNENLSIEDIQKLRRKAYKSFYTRPRYLLSAVSIAMKHKSLRPILNFYNWH